MGCQEPRGAAQEPPGHSMPGPGSIGAGQDAAAWAHELEPLTRSQDDLAGGQEPGGAAQEPPGHSRPAPTSIGAGQDAAASAHELEPMMRSQDDPEGGQEPGGAAQESPKERQRSRAFRLAVCFLGLQASYLCWGYMQEKVMTKMYETGKFPSATFCVFSNRVVAIVVALVLMLRQNGTMRIPASMHVFALCSISNSVSSYAQYEALHYVSFLLQTLSKSTKVIPVMLMGKVLNGKSYAWGKYAQAVAISAAVSMFSLSETSGKRSVRTPFIGVLLLALHITADSFTSQWQSRIYANYPSVDQFQMMFAINVGSMILTTGALLVSGEMWTTIQFLSANMEALSDNAIISFTSATGQLFIFYTIKEFGPVTFTIIMTTRQMASLVLSAILFRHPVGALGYLSVCIVFALAFYRIGPAPAKELAGFVRSWCLGS